MLKITIAAILLIAVAAPTVLFATQAQQGASEVRISAFKHSDGRIEFGLQSKEGNTWGERTLPRVRFLPSNARSGRWYHSSGFTIGAEPSTSMTAEDESATSASTGHLGPLYQWPCNGYECESLSQYRVEWSTANPNGSQHILITSPYEDGHGCDGNDSCRYELMLWCGADTDLHVLLRHFWLNDRVWDAWDYDPQIGQSQPAVPNRITTSVDHSSFTREWLVYNPPGQSRYPNEYYGIDFMLRGEAAQSFMNQVRTTDGLTVTVAHPWYHSRGDETFTFNTEGAFDNPAVEHLARCGLE